MKTRIEIETHLRTLTQAYYFFQAHRSELTSEARLKLRTLEENIQLLNWCLEEPRPEDLSWHSLREMFRSTLRLSWRTLAAHIRRSEPEQNPPGTQ